MTAQATPPPITPTMRACRCSGSNGRAGGAQCTVVSKSRAAAAANMEEASGRTTAPAYASATTADVDRQTVPTHGHASPHAGAATACRADGDKAQKAGRGRVSRRLAIA